MGSGKTLLIFLLVNNTKAVIILGVGLVMENEGENITKNCKCGVYVLNAVLKKPIPPLIVLFVPRETGSEAEQDNGGSGLKFSITTAVQNVLAVE